MINAQIPIIGFTAYSGTGKTTLLKKLLPIFRDKGLRVGMIKHTHHTFEVDQPGKDSYELRKAGASEMLIASGRRWALMVDTEIEGDPELQDMLDRLDQSVLDLILVEGFKHVVFPKLELHRPSLGKPLLFPEDPDVIAVLSDGELAEATDLPILDINDAAAIVEFIISRFLGEN